MIKRILLLLSLLLPSATFSQSADTLQLDYEPLPWPESLQYRLDSMIASDPLLETSQLGLMVYDLTADSTLFTLNHRQTMRPASTMKLVTAITALDMFGSDYRLRTAMYYTGSVADGRLNGDIYCMGGMDPAFDSDDMNLFVSSLTRMGVDTICGRIVADMSMKDTLKWGQGWCWDDNNPTLTPLLLNRRPYFMEKLCDRMIEAGINLDSAYLDTGFTPAEAGYVCSRNHTLAEILVKMMKDSNNLYAESVFYQLATDRQPATAQHARDQVKMLITRLGLKADQYRIADGSGLSLYNYLSPELETIMLRHAWRQRRIFKTLLPSLPIAGVDGTLRNRMKGTAAEGNVTAKTGTLAGVSTLAGYCIAPNGHQLCFSIMNQGMQNNREPRAFQDRLCRLLCE